MARSSFAGVLFCAVCAFGCGGTTRRSTYPGSPAADLEVSKPPPTASGGQNQPNGVVDLDTIRIQVVSRTASGDPELATVATADLFNNAAAAWKDGRGDDAIGLYRRLVTEFPTSRYASLSLHNIAAIYDKRGDPNSTIAALKELIAAYPSSSKAIESRLYIAAILSEQNQWAGAVSALNEALSLDGLSYAGRVEAWARKGYALLQLGQLDAADSSLSTAVAEWRRAPRIDDSYFIAMAHFYRGEVAHKRFLETRVSLPDEELGRTLAEKERLAATAYDFWKLSLSLRHPYWATASGYQMSQIFFELWEATVRAPYPSTMSHAARAHYVVEVHRRVRTHLEKALTGHQMNLQLADAYGVTTSWSEASRLRVVQLSEIIKLEASGQLEVTPP